MEADEYRKLSEVEDRVWYFRPLLASSDLLARAQLGLVAFAALATLFAYAWTLDGYFVGDDFGFVARYFDFPLADWPRLFVHNWKDGLWDDNHHELRPLNALAFMIDARIWGLNPAGFRATNLLLHAATAFLVGLLARRVCRDWVCGFAAVVIFAVHPAHAGAVSWITGRVDLLATLFYLAAFLAFLRYRERGRGCDLAALIACAAACLYTKESGYTFPLAIVAADLIWLQPRWSGQVRTTWLPYIGLAGVFLVYSVCRHIAFGTGGIGTVGGGLPDVTTSAFYADLLHRQLAYVAHSLPPLANWLDEWVAGGRVFAVRHILRLGAVALVLVGSGVLFRRWRNGTIAPSDRRATIFFAVAWYLVTSGPLVVSYVSPRHLYPAIAGLTIALVLLLRTLVESPPVRIAAGTALTLLCGWQLRESSRLWHDAALHSKIIANEITAISRVSPAGSALILDVAAFNGRAFCWAWAVPHALRPPFTHGRLDERFVVVAPPGTAAYQGSWRTQPALERLAHLESECWLIRGPLDRPIQRIAAPAERVRAAARQMVTQRHSPDRAWQQFILALSP